jgi:hypothetical protein
MKGHERALGFDDTGDELHRSRVFTELDKARYGLELVEKFVVLHPQSLHVAFDPREFLRHGKHLGHVPKARDGTDDAPLHLHGNSVRENARSQKILLLVQFALARGEHCGKTRGGNHFLHTAPYGIALDTKQILGPPVHEPDSSFRIDSDDSLRDGFDDTVQFLDDPCDFVGLQTTHGPLDFPGKDSSSQKPHSKTEAQCDLEKTIEHPHLFAYFRQKNAHGNGPDLVSLEIDGNEGPHGRPERSHRLGHIGLSAKDEPLVASHKGFSDTLLHGMGVSDSSHVEEDDILRAGFLSDPLCNGLNYPLTSRFAQRALIIGDLRDREGHIHGIFTEASLELGHNLPARHETDHGEARAEERESHEDDLRPNLQRMAKSLPSVPQTAKDAAGKAPLLTIGHTTSQKSQDPHCCRVKAAGPIS